MDIPVTIMIPAFNQPAYIVQAVNSALAQDYANLEVVVADDSTNEETFNALQPLRTNNRLRYHRNTSNIGRVANYKRLLFELAKGEWAVMLDGDDYYIDNTFISRAMALVQSDAAIVLAGAAIKVLNEGTGQYSHQGLESEKAVFDGKEMFTKYPQLPNHQTDIYNRALACSLNFYRHPSTASDSESLYRLCLHGKVAYLPEAVAVWRVHNSNETYNRSLKSQVDELSFIDSIYEYAIPFTGRPVAQQWRTNMYKGMVGHLLHLAFEKGSTGTIVKLLFKFSSLLGPAAVARYTVRLSKMKLQPKATAASGT